MSGCSHQQFCAVVVLRVAVPTGPGVLTRRALTIELVGVDRVSCARLHTGDREVDVAVVPAAAGGPPLVVLWSLDLSAGLELRLDGVRTRPADLAAQVFTLLDDAEIASVDNERVLALTTSSAGTALLGELDALGLTRNLYGAFVELVMN